MTQISTNNNIPINNGYTQNVPQAPTMAPQVNVTTPQGVTAPIYQYPTMSLYNADPNSKQQTSGVNIIINNPSGAGNGVYYPMGYPPCCCNHGATINNSPSFVNNVPSSSPAPLQSPAAPQEPMAQVPLSATSTATDTTDNKKAKKEVVQITDEYVKSIESYLRSPDKDIRQMGITDLIKRFEEDSSRYNHPALTALLNIALQDPSVHNRIMAMTPIATESANGNQETSELLQKIIDTAKAKEKDSNGNKSPIYIEEAKMAQEALLKTAQTKA